MCVTRQRFRVADTEVTRTRFERLAKRQRTECRVTARTAASDHEPFRIDFSAISKVAGAIRAVVNVNDSPFLVQSFAILPAVAGTAAIVDVEDRKSPAGPILD